MSVLFTTEKPKPGTLADWLDTVDDGLGVERLHTIRTIQRQSVAEHTAHAQAIAVYLVEQNRDARLDAVMLHLLQHDVAEQATGDMPADAKQRSPSLSHILSEAEREWSRDNLLDFYITIEEHAICKMADWIELQRFCIRERRMGNKLIKPVFHNITRYITDSEYLTEIEGAAKLVQKNISRWTQVHYYPNTGDVT